MQRIMSSKERIRKSVWKCIQIRMLHRRLMRHSRSWMQLWLAYRIPPRDDSTIKLEMQMLFSKESLKGEETANITSIEATLDTLETKISYHPKNSLTLCSSGSSHGVSGWDHSSNKDIKDSSAGRGREMRIWAFSSDKCCQCFYSSSSHYSQACSRVASFRTVRTTITACSAPIITNSS